MAGPLYPCHPGHFYPRPPRGGRRELIDKEFGGVQFLSTPSARRATRAELIQVLKNCISIHALREEGDLPLEEEDARKWAISIHALREEGDPLPARKRKIFFISIHALREEGDGGAGKAVRSAPYFYPRPPRGGRPMPRKLVMSPKIYFYPRPPRGGRPSNPSGGGGEPEFLSTPSARRATSSQVGRQGPQADFYPRPPRGGRQRVRSTQCLQHLFLSTPSARRAT